jgi:flagellar hook-associated protein 2
MPRSLPSPLGRAPAVRRRGQPLRLVCPRRCSGAKPPSSFFLMAGIQLSGLASGFDWKSFTDSVMELERAPARRYAAEQAKNDTKKSQLSSLGTKLASLQTAMSALSASTLGAGRTVVNQSSAPVVQATVSSATPVGTYEAEVTQLATASRLTGSVLPSPPSGIAGTLNIQGTAAGAVTPITITADMDVAAIVAAINDSSAGVTAISNKAGTQIVLTNRVTGAGNDIVVTDASGGALRSALGLATTPTTARDTAFTINGLGFTSADITLTADDHGIAGLTLKADAVMTSAETLTVSADSSGMRGKIDTFVSTFNAVADFIETATEYTTTGGKTTAGPLADNREIQTWLKQLRATAFGAPASGAITNLAALGLDFSSSNARITVKDSTKLDAALADHAADVATFFNNRTAGSEGLATAFGTKLATYIGPSGTAGQLSTKLESYTKANTSLDSQIAALDRYLAQRRSQLEAGFMAMETAQSKMTQMQTQLTQAFGQKK